MHPHNRMLTGRSALAADLILAMVRSGSYSGDPESMSRWGHSLADEIYAASDQEMADWNRAQEASTAGDLR